MALERSSRALVLSSVVLLGAFSLLWLGVVPQPWSDDRTEVRVVGDDGTVKATIDAEVAETARDRYVGLSDHDSLEAGEGMLFVHQFEGERTYVMRDMDFDIDMLFVGADGEITTIHHARAPDPDEDGSDLRYSGRAKWVLEVPAGTVEDAGIAVGDEIEIDDGG